MNTNKKIARVVGLLFLAGMVIGIIGNILIQTILGTPGYRLNVAANNMKVATGVLREESRFYINV